MSTANVNVVKKVDNGLIRLVLTEDNHGLVAVLLPSALLLDIKVLWEASERDGLRPLAAEHLQERIPADGDWTALLQDLEVWCDSSLDRGSEMHLVEPVSGQSALWVPQGDIKVAPLACELPPDDYQVDEYGAITKAVEKFTVRRMHQRLEDTLGLPALAPTTQKIVMLRSSPTATIDDLAPIVEIDPSLSAQVMSWATSPYYAAPGKISSIREAIIRVLGFDLVVNLALGIGMGRVLNVPKDTPRGARSYWQQAVYVATLSEQLVRALPLERRPQIGLVYLSGLLHNFGYLVLGHLFPPQFSLLSRYIEANHTIDASAIERHVLKVTRAQIGAWLMESWNLPVEVCDAIRQQGRPDPVGVEPIYPQLLRYSVQLLRQEGLYDGPVLVDLEESREALGLSAAKVEAAIERLYEQRDHIAGLTKTFSQA